MLDDEPKEPFLLPFIVSLAFGIPVMMLWFYVALEIGFLATIITILLGFACGLGAKVSSGGSHASGAALLSTFILILISISTITVAVIADEHDQTLMATLKALLEYGTFNGFANACVEVGGRTVAGYPLGLLAAFNASDPE